MTKLDQPIRLGIIGSSGGSALIGADTCLRMAGLKVEWVVISDRECGLESWSRSAGHNTFRMPYLSASTFSEAACRVFQEAGCTDVLLFFTRRVAAPLIDELRIWNVHPSLLPAFPGLHGLEEAWHAKVAIFGATLHRVDKGLDTGPISAQVAAPLRFEHGLQRLQRVSFFQKVWLTLVWFNIVTGFGNRAPQTSCEPGVSVAWPSLSGELYEVYREWVALQEVAV